MWLKVEGVIYFYIAICVALLFFNVLYITRSKRVARRRARRVSWWEQALEQANTQGTARELERLFSRLKNTEELLAFHQVMDALAKDDPDRVHAFFRDNRQAVYELALEYGRKPAMERAFFAYVLASFHPPAENGHDLLSEILLGYLEDSTVYCRENVLCALYALGSEQAVEHAFELLNERGWYHHPRLLSDGMVKFTGDRAALVRRLWRNRKRWAEFLSVAVVQLASGLEDDFSGPFLDGLRNEALPLETRFALIRYFGRRGCSEAKPVLLDLLQGGGGDESGLAIAAAASVVKYPGEDTRQALKNALHSRNWYVRRNAAGSLAALGITDGEREEIRSSGDRYAVEMLEYMTGPEREAPEPQGMERAVAAV